MTRMILLLSFIAVLIVEFAQPLKVLPFDEIEAEGWNRKPICKENNFKDNVRGISYRGQNKQLFYLVFQPVNGRSKPTIKNRVRI
ncbi:MAG: hypothetical protein WKF91_18925 [Segetibacter sp.]